MQDDKHLHELLMKGGLEKASPAFTQNVIKRIERIKYIHEPLVSKKWVRVYRITFVCVLGLVLLVGLLIKLSSLSFTINLSVPEQYKKYTGTIILYIVAFWALIFLSQNLEGKRGMFSGK